MHSLVLRNEVGAQTVAEREPLREVRVKEIENAIYVLRAVEYPAECGQIENVIFGPMSPDNNIPENGMSTVHGAESSKYLNHSPRSIFVVLLHRFAKIQNDRLERPRPRLKLSNFQIDVEDIDHIVLDPLDIFIEIDSFELVVAEPTVIRRRSVIISRSVSIRIRLPFPRSLRLLDPVLKILEKSEKIKRRK